MMDSMSLKISWHRSRTAWIVSIALIECLNDLALVKVDCSCFKTEQNKLISMPICLASAPAEPIDAVIWKRVKENLVPAPMTPMMLEIRPRFRHIISGREIYRGTILT
jgi:hypothetical protein